MKTANESVDNPLHDSVASPRYQTWRWNLSNNPPPPGGSGSLSGQGSKHLPSRSQPKTISSGMPFLVIDNSLDSVSPRNLRQPLSRSLTVLKMDIRRNLHTLHRDELMHWNQVLRECGAVYHRNCIYFTPLLSVLFFFFFEANNAY